MSVIKYRTNRWGNIEAMPVSRETDKMVFIAGRNGKETREAKACEWQQWHDTWEAARDALLKKAEADVVTARHVLERAKGRLGNIKGMKKPE